MFFALVFATITDALSDLLTYINYYLSYQAVYRERSLSFSFRKPAGVSEGLKDREV